MKTGLFLHPTFLHFRALRSQGKLPLVHPYVHRQEIKYYFFEEGVRNKDPLVFTNSSKVKSKTAVYNPLATSFYAAKRLNERVHYQFERNQSYKAALKSVTHGSRYYFMTFFQDEVMSLSKKLQYFGINQYTDTALATHLLPHFQKTFLNLQAHQLSSN